ncbi:MAG: PEP-CTERM sorting domain-containing protein [Caulobacteraceae bacterium]
MRVVSAAVAALTLAAAGSAHAAIVVDVDNVVLPPAGTTTYSGLAAVLTPANSVQIFQTWTSMDQGQLATLELFGGFSVFGAPPPSFTYTLSIYGGDVRQSGSVLLGQEDFLATTIHDHSLRSFDLSGLSISTAPGEVMTFGFSVKTCDPSLTCLFAEYDTFSATQTGPVLATSNGGYAGGQAFNLVNGAYGSPLGFDGGRDMSFRISVNDSPVAPVPEPGAWALMLSGMFGAGAMMRRRRLVALPLSR